jgi:hypothetical protein
VKEIVADVVEPLTQSSVIQEGRFSPLHPKKEHVQSDHHLSLAGFRHGSLGAGLFGICGEG